MFHRLIVTLQRGRRKIDAGYIYAAMSDSGQMNLTLPIWNVWVLNVFA
jgi:hypothetical protein